MEAVNAPNGVMYSLKRWEWVNGVKSFPTPMLMYKKDTELESRDVAIREFRERYEQGERARVPYEYELRFVVIEGGRVVHNHPILANDYEAVVRGLAFEADYYRENLSRLKSEMKPLNEVIGNDPKKMGIFTHHVTQLGMERYPNIITAHKVTLIDQMQSRIDFLWNILLGRRDQGPNDDNGDNF